MENTNTYTLITLAGKLFAWFLNIICEVILLLLKSIEYIFTLKWFKPLCDHCVSLLKGIAYLLDDIVSVFKLLI